jgi:hypothetical protein
MLRSLCELFGGEARHVFHDLRHRSRRRKVVRGNSDTEAIFQLGDGFEHLERVESEVRDEIALERWIDRPAADVLQHVDNARFDGG